MGDVIVLGRDAVGTVAEDRDPGYKTGPMRYYLTECCGASAKGSSAGGEPATVCRACYTEVDPALGGVPDSEARLADGRVTFVVKPLSLVESYGDGLPYDTWKTRHLTTTTEETPCA